jgi:hypothetical protein
MVGWIKSECKNAMNLYIYIHINQDDDDDVGDDDCKSPTKLLYEQQKRAF